MAQPLVSTFTQVPERAWWLIYINPKDHAEALAKASAGACPTPADLYDCDESQGYRSGMEAAFRLLFQQTPPLVTIDSRFYRELHQVAIGALAGDNNHELVEEWSTGTPAELINRAGKSAGSVSFPMTQDGERAMAVDLADETVVIDDRAVSVLTQLPEDNGQAEAMLLSRDGAHADRYACLLDQNLISVNYPRARAPQLVDAVGTRFAGELRDADSELNRLRAIVKLIRALHVLHLFTNANGRLNITLLLTKLLLDQGLGPVLLANMDDLFSGSYTVDEMVDGVRAGLVAFQGAQQAELERQDRDGHLPPLAPPPAKPWMDAILESARRCTIL